MSNKKLKTMEAIVEKMTPKQAKFFSLWLQNGNGTRSAMEAYDTTDVNTAGAIASENLRNLKNPVKTYLEHKGLGISNLAKVLAEALTAEKTDITGDIHPDHRTRMEAVDRLSKWLDIEPKEQVVQQTNIQVNLTRGEE